MTPEQRQLVEGLAAIMAVSPSDEDRAYAVSITASLAALDAAEQERDQARQARADEAREYGLAASARRGLLYELRQRAEQAEAKLAALTAPPAPHAEAVRMTLDRYGVNWPKKTAYALPLTLMSDGYWTPWHIADEALRVMQGRAEQGRAEAVRVLEEVKRSHPADVGSWGRSYVEGVRAVLATIDAKLAALRAEGEGGDRGKD